MAVIDSEETRDEATGWEGGKGSLYNPPSISTITFGPMLVSCGVGGREG